ncbi:ubiquitin carboxyl-terminal hydrolase 37-like isoform X2 [Engraulis encrasicolus]|uniref:ubiquitin carboxyl-terminal hydrolase 37-like isoform X2 n=1 Tax=Engraulis encrasicolus TaxID=184585 RepID=UPI002FCE86FE
MGKCCSKCCRKQSDDEDDFYTPASVTVTPPRRSSTPPLSIRRSSSWPVFPPPSTLPSLSPPPPTTLSHSCPDITIAIAIAIAAPIPSPPASQPPPALGSSSPSDSSSTAPTESSGSGLPLVVAKNLGFPNLGNTCYMNATIQALLALKPFVNDVLNCWGNGHSPILRSMAELQMVRQTSGQGQTKGMLLTAIRRSMSAICPEFLGDRQQDAHEFFLFLLIQMKEEGASLLAHRCPVANLEFYITTIYTCSTCGISRDREEMFNHLSLPAEGGVEHSLDSYFQTTLVEYSCQLCAGRQATAKPHFTTMPKILVIHLKRFDSKARKTSHDISIPLQLRLSSGEDVQRAWSPPPIGSAMDSEGKESSGDRVAPTVHTYHLASVVSHLGSSLKRGHYVCDAVGEEGSGGLCFNDNSVKCVKDIERKRQSTAYLLFYEHRT